MFLLLLFIGFALLITLVNELGKREEKKQIENELQGSWDFFKGLIALFILGILWFLFIVLPVIVTIFDPWP